MESIKIIHRRITELETEINNLYKNPPWSANNMRGKKEWLLFNERLLLILTGCVYVDESQ
jgi:hypothetical protein